MSKKGDVSVELARQLLWKKGNLSFLLDTNQQSLYEMFHKNPSTLQTWLLSRRCLAEGTLIKTPKGLVPIEKLKVGDEVFGYNEDGTVSVTKVLETFNNGVKEVVDIVSLDGSIRETCTPDHVWLVYDYSIDKYRQIPVKEFTQNTWIVKKDTDDLGKLYLVLPTIKNTRQMNTYDIHVGNSTNLYLTANGLVTHNSGKSYSLCILAIEYCIRHPNAIIKFVSPNREQVERNIRPLMAQILSSCPKDLEPQFSSKHSTYYFNNKSEIQLAGANKGNVDSIRGGFSHISIIDEAQDVTELEYAINSVLLPTTLTTRGKILISGTPPKDVDHDFIKFIELCEANNALVIRTVYDNPRLTPEDIQKQADAMGGVNSESFRREFLCHIIKSKSVSVIPEFDEDKIKELVKPASSFKTPPHYHAFVGMDVGGRDWTVILFGYLDFKRQKIVFQDELVYKGQEMYTPTIGRDIMLLEETLWTDPMSGEFRKPKKRVSDHNPIFINDIKKHTNYKVIFENAEKKDKAAAIVYFRSLINDNMIEISEKCTTLIRHIKNAKWLNKTTNTEFGKCPEGSHYDALDAAIYFVRAIDFKTNPYPSGYGSNIDPSGHFTPPNTTSNSSMNAYKKLLNIKK